MVRFCIQGASAPSPGFEWTPTRLVAALQAGLPFREVQELQAGLAVPVERLAQLLGLSKATFHRRKGDAGTLSPAVSDRPPVAFTYLAIPVDFDPSLVETIDPASLPAD